jgi:uncharacterized protein YjbJ (UPF0337 family)
MKPSTKDDVEGKMHQVEGKIKETVGKVVGTATWKLKARSKIWTGKFKKNLARSRRFLASRDVFLGEFKTN